jgi:hypothetical protein
VLFLAGAIFVGMAIASLVLAIVAVLIALASAVYTARQASAAEGALAIEHARRLEELRPRLSGWIARQSQGDSWLWVVLVSDEALAKADFRILAGQGMRFLVGDAGIDDPFNVFAGVIASDRAFAYLPGNRGGVVRQGIRPHRPVSWRTNLIAKPGTIIRIAVTCVGERKERWDVLLEVEVQDA